MGCSSFFQFLVASVVTGTVIITASSDHPDPPTALSHGINQQPTRQQSELNIDQ